MEDDLKKGRRPNKKLEDFYVLVFLFFSPNKYYMYNIGIKFTMMVVLA
jgi:hypothetical protein